MYVHKLSYESFEENQADFKLFSFVNYFKCLLNNF